MSRFARHEMGSLFINRRKKIVYGSATLFIVFSFILLLFYYFPGCFTNPESEVSGIGNSSDYSNKAALIDPLYSTYPDLDVTKSFNRTMQEVGFEVDIYLGKEVTVEFL